MKAGDIQKGIIVSAEVSGNGAWCGGGTQHTLEQSLEETAGGLALEALRKELNKCMHVQFLLELARRRELDTDVALMMSPEYF